MRQPVHFDLDQMERQIRAMYANIEKADPQLEEPDRTTHHWQKRFCNTLVAFMRWQLEMEMAGVPDSQHAYIVGVALAELAQQVFGQYSQDEGKIQAAQAIMQGYTQHTNQCLHSLITKGECDYSTSIRPVTSGRA